MIDIIQPEVLYHYTTQDGLLGILKEKALWTTKIQYMNDASELSWPAEIASNILRTLAKQIGEEGVEDKEKKLEIINRMLDDIGEWSQVNICVASFCTNGDLLSQWRGYGTLGSAYAIGFDSKELVKSVSGRSFELRQCEYYKSAEYKERITEFVLQVINEALKENKRPEGFIGKFINTASTMKLEHFEEEGEWRIISWSPRFFTDEEFKFRPGKSTLIPYYSLPIELSAIVEIIVGPSPNQQLAHSAVCGLSHKYKLAEVQRGRVKTSEIPYRSL